MHVIQCNLIPDNRLIFDLFFVTAELYLVTPNANLTSSKLILNHEFKSFNSIL